MTAVHSTIFDIGVALKSNEFWFVASMVLFSFVLWLAWNKTKAFARDITGKIEKIEFQTKRSSTLADLFDDKLPIFFDHFRACQSNHDFLKNYIVPLSETMRSHANDLEDFIDSANRSVEGLMENEKRLERIVSATELMASEAHWKSCPIEKCPAMTGMKSMLEKMSEEQKRFAIEAEDSRRKTQERLDAASEAQHKLGTDVIRAILGWRMEKQNGP